MKGKSIRSAHKDIVIRNSNNNNNDHKSESGNNSETSDGIAMVSYDETSALFDDLMQERCADGQKRVKYENNVQLVWKELDYSVDLYEWNFPSLKFFTRKKKNIIRNISGSISSGSLTALIGPSGAGKSSLLEILSGRREKGVTGSISVRFDSQKHASRTKIAFMGQQDLFCGNLTVKETLMYASKLKNYSAQGILKKKFKSQAFCPEEEVVVTRVQIMNEIRNYHANLVAEILEELFLSSCANVYVRNCSGGQQKRLSIACELVSRPDILLLDEPTSGLGKQNDRQASYVNVVMLSLS